MSNGLLFPRPTAWPVTGRCALLQRTTARGGDHLLGRSGWASLVVCLSGLPLSLCSNGIGTISQQCQAGLGSSPCARCSLRQNPRRLGPAPAQLAPSTSPPSPHRIARLECLYPGLRLVSQTAFLTSPALCPLLVSLAWIGAMLPGCEASPKHGDLREPAVAGAALPMAHVAQARGQIRECML